MATVINKAKKCYYYNHARNFLHISKYENVLMNNEKFKIGTAVVFIVII